MQKIRITITKNTQDPNDDLRYASKVRQDLWARSPVEIDPGDPHQATHRDEQGNAYFEFFSDYLDEVKRVVREFGHENRITVTVQPGSPGEKCVNCGHELQSPVPTVCPNCGFREINPCPHCGHEISRARYVTVQGDICECPDCHHMLRLAFHDPVSDPEGNYYQPLVCATRVEA